MVAATTLVDSASPFERLFVQEYRRVVSVAFRITGDAGDAEDVAQETFVRFARSGHAQSDRARAWLYSAAVNAALNQLRSRKRRTQRELRHVRLAQPAIETQEHAGDPQVVIERRFDRALVREALLRLSPRDAQVLSLRYGGLSYREVAEAAGIDAAQVGTRLARAERALRKELERGTSR